MSEIAELYRSESYSHRVAAEVRAHASRMGIYQKDIARALGIDPSQVSGRMRGRIAFQLDELAILARLFGIQPAQLLPSTHAFIGEARMETAAQAAAAARMATAGELATQTEDDQECTVRDSNPEPAGFALPAGDRSRGGLVLLGGRVLSIVRTPDPDPRPTSRTRPRAIGRTCHTPGAA
jgi:transcriptional regulator with XRE-family HTH domain